MVSLRDPHVFGTVAVCVAAVGGAVAWLKLRRKPTPEEIERERRAQLVRSGRIIDGTILDIAEAEPDTQDRGIRFISYNYEIGGVEYECSQDVTALRDNLKPDDLRLGFPCSVRYDVRRPENSIVLAENWSGLRLTARSVPLERTAHGRKPRGPASVTQLPRRD
ncbi:MAG TPA: DUF3592 domain-containing protein [Acidobacteriaceae bacterium]|nr:DUF3592 domain-containing protein [Acidobacteriaceae bacterium]